ncbi:hypothetical protein DFJ73DRAFT_807951 [Zopfochytrium polystomum]|nr:hypothetical protein DFJ73DRAFT_807951 [Zopfochytrium polystomum]
MPPQPKKQKVDANTESENANGSSFDISEDARSKLDGVLSKMKEISEQEQEEIDQINKKYNKHRQSVYTERNALIKSIKGFWREAFLNHPYFSESINEKESEVVQYIRELIVEEPADSETVFTIVFESNPFFSAPLRIKKTVKLDEEGNTVADKIAIKWNSGKNPTEEKKPEKEGGKRKRKDDDEDDEDADDDENRPPSFFKWLAWGGDADEDGNGQLYESMVRDCVDWNDCVNSDVMGVLTFFSQYFGLPFSPPPVEHDRRRALRQGHRIGFGS